MMRAGVRAPGERRLPALALLALLLVGGVVWLLWPGDEDLALDPTVGSVSAVQADADLLHGGQAQAADLERGLQGRGRGGGPPPTRGDVRVRVFGRGGVPLPDVVVVAVPKREFGSDRPVLRTDGSGVTVLRDLPYDGSVEAAIFVGRRALAFPVGARRGTILVGAGDSRRAVTGPRLVFHIDRGITLDLRVVDAETGRDVPRVALDFGNAPALKAVHLGTGARRFLVLVDGWGRLRVLFSVQPPAGWVAWSPSAFDTPVSPYARGLWAVHPVWPRVEVSVTVLEPDGSPAEAKVASASILGPTGHPTVEFRGTCDKYGCLRLRGVPHLRDEVLSVVVGRRDDTGFMQLRTALPERRGVPVDLRLTLPERDPDGIIGTVETDNDLPYEESFGSNDHVEPPEPAHENEVAVTVRRHNGDPAVGARVDLAGETASTDTRGVARFRSVAPGRQQFLVRQYGLLPIGDEVLVPAVGQATKSVQERAGGTLLLSVVDDLDRPLPFASFRLATPSGWPWVDLEGGRQRLDLFTDQRGQRTLRHVEAGRSRVTVRWGARGVVQEVVVKEEQEVRLKVSLARPEAPTGPPTCVVEMEVEEEIPSGSGR